MNADAICRSLHNEGDNGILPENQLSFTSIQRLEMDCWGTFSLEAVMFISIRYVQNEQLRQLKSDQIRAFHFTAKSARDPN